jgi:putative acetyltransferase
MITCKRTDSENEDFKKLVRELDKELAIIDGSDHAFYSQYNKIDAIKHVVVAYEDDIPVGCGAIKEYAGEPMQATEVKRMYVPKDKRNRGIASRVLNELETWAKELNYKLCVLETGKRQPDAVQLYNKNGYRIIPNYGQYVGVENSVCFGKYLLILK